MYKKNTGISKGNQRSLSRHKSYSIEEIMAAGGATAFANKMGKKPANIDNKLKEIPKDAFLTKEEVLLALQRLDESK